MSVREYVINYLGGSRSAGGAGGGVASNSSGSTGSHRLDGPEHLAPVDGTRLDASTTAHGLLPKLSGSATDALLGDGTWGALDGYELNTDGGQSVIKAHGAAGAAETISPADGNVHEITLDADCTFTLSAPAGTGACTLELRLTQDGTGGWDVTWPGSVTLLGTLDTTASTTTIVILETLDAGTSWVAVVVGSGGTVSGGTPALTFGTSNAAGVATTAVLTDATIAIFDATAPVTQAFGDAAATGSADFAARRDHVHGMPSSSVTAAAVSALGFVGPILISDAPSTPLVFADLLQNEDQDDLIYADL